MRAFLMALLLLVAGVAGCSDAGDDDPQPTASTSASASRSPSSSSTATTSASSTSSAPAANQPPTGGVSAVLNGTLAAFNLTGQDPDGDAVSWTLAFGDGNVTNGTSLPAAVEHTYVPGNYSVRYNVTDGRLTSTFNLTLTVNATAGGGIIQTVTGSWDLGSPPTCAPSYANPYHPANAAAHEVIHFIADVDPATIGHTFTATFGAPGPGQQSARMWFSNPATINIQAFAAAGSPPVATGVVPEGAEKVTFAVCGPQGSSITYTA